MCDVEEGHYSSALCHLANVSYRLGRSLDFDPVQGRFPGDPEANAMLTRIYRRPFVVPGCPSSSDGQMSQGGRLRRTREV